MMSMDFIGYELTIEFESLSPFSAGFYQNDFLRNSTLLQSVLGLWFKASYASTPNTNANRMQNMKNVALRSTIWRFYSLYLGW
jgi:hypothetical protein